MVSLHKFLNGDINCST